MRNITLANISMLIINLNKGIVDGFNPLLFTAVVICGIWLVLEFLILKAINTKDKNKNACNP